MGGDFLKRLPYKVRCPVCKDFFQPRHASQLLCGCKDCHGVMTKDEQIDVSSMILKELDSESKILESELDETS